MKLTKNTVIRATALILFMSMIAAIILYDGGAYDFTFVKRPVVYTTAGETTGGGEGPADTTGGDDTTVTQPPMNDDEIQEILSKIKELDEALANGYSPSYSKFGNNSALAKVDAPYLEGEFALTTHNVTKRVLYEMANGTLSTRNETEVQDLPRIRLYYGYAIVNNGKTNSVYNKNGEKISEYIELKLLYQKTYDGMPVIESGGKYYKIAENGLHEIQGSEIKYLPMSVDAPRYYAASNIDLYPFMERIMVLTQVGVVTTEPPPTTPEDTTPDETTAPDETTPDATTTPEETTTPDVTTTPDITTAADTTDAPNAREITGTASIADTTTTETETTAPNTTESETTAPEQDTPTVTEPNEGDIIEKDGKLYKVSYRELYGYKNGAGKVVITPQYTMAYDFTSDGIACVIYENYRLMYIDTKGNRVISLLDSPYVEPADFNYKKHYQGLYAGINNDVSDMGMYYCEDGYVMVRYALLDAKTATKLVKTVNRLYNKKGNMVNIPGSYSLENYSDGVMLVSKNGRYGYLNMDSSWVATPVFDEARPFFQGLAVAHSDGGYGMIDVNGNTVLPFIFDYISHVSDGRVAAYSSESGWQIYTIVSK